MSAKIKNFKVSQSDDPENILAILKLDVSHQVAEPKGSPDVFQFDASSATTSPEKHSSSAKPPSIFASFKTISEFYKLPPTKTFPESPWFDPTVSSPENIEFLKILASQDTALREIALEYLATEYQKSPKAIFLTISAEMSEPDFRKLLRQSPHTKAVTKLLEGLERQLAEQGIAKFENGETPSQLERVAMQTALPMKSKIRGFLATKPYSESFTIRARGKLAYRAMATKAKLNFPWFYNHTDDPEGLLKRPVASRLASVQPNEISPRVWRGMSINQRRSFIDSLRGVSVAKVYTSGLNKYTVPAAAGFALKLWESGDKKAFLQAVATVPEGIELHLPKGAAKYVAQHLGELVAEMKSSRGEWSGDEAVLVAKLIGHHLKQNIGDDPDNMVIAVSRLAKAISSQLPPTPQHIGTTIGVVLGGLLKHIQGIKASDEKSIALFKKIGFVFGTFGGTYGKAFSGAIKTVLAFGLYKIRDHRELVSKLRGSMEWHWTRAAPLPMQDPKTGELRSDPSFGLIAARRLDAMMHLLGDH